MFFAAYCVIDGDSNNYKQLFYRRVVINMRKLFYTYDKYNTHTLEYITFVSFLNLSKLDQSFNRKLNESTIYVYFPRLLSTILIIIYVARNVHFLMLSV